ncbi:MAG: 5-formyltetrahydrofolate cyclo-ligase [Mycoplasma sp.]
MRLKKIQNSTINILKSFTEKDHRIFSKMLCKQFEKILENSDFNNILIIHNADFEVGVTDIIKKTLKLKKNIYLLSRKNNKFSMIDCRTFDGQLEFISYSQQPVFKKVISEVKIDLILFPILAYDKTLKVLDYDLNFNLPFVFKKYFKEAKKCAYSLCCQEHSNLNFYHAKYEVDFLINEFNFFKKLI